MTQRTPLTLASAFGYLTTVGLGSLMPGPLGDPGLPAQGISGLDDRAQPDPTSIKTYQNIARVGCGGGIAIPQIICESRAICGKSHVKARSSKVPREAWV